MKLTLLAGATALALGLAVSSSAFAAADTGGTLTFNGAVTDGTCVVIGGPGTGGETGNITVALDPVPAATLNANKNGANPHDFTIIVGDSGDGKCDQTKIATMSFLPSSQHIDAATGALRNALANEATDTQIQLMNGGTAINLADPSYSVDFPAFVNGRTSLPFTARYISPTGNATPGLVSTNVVYAISYK
ncbi:fimbrial protein [Dyella sp.]|uniref:fimbrial protein n=1 Tax=Dyella sp. TaxID=1869338 RepID=UPI002ED34C8E